MDIELKPSPTGQGITPQMPIEPPKEVKDMTFTFDPSMMSDGGDGTTITTDKGVELKEVKPDVVEATKEEVAKPTKEEVKSEPIKKDTKKVEDVTPVKTAEDKSTKVEVAPKSDAKPSKLISPIKDKGTEQDAFDYTKYAPHEVTNMKNMSRQSREAYVKLIDENKQLASLKDANYLQHERGYTLSPEYQDLSQKTILAQTEGQVWEQCLINIKQGKPIREIVGFDANGNAQLGPEKTASDKDEIRIMNNVNACIQATKQYSNQLQQYPNQFKDRMTQDLRDIQNERNERFAWVQDPKLMDAPIEVEGGGQQKISDIKNNFKSLFPIYYRNNPGVEVASDLMVALMIRTSELKEARKGKQISDIVDDERTSAEPSSEERQVESTSLQKKGIPSVFSLEGLPGR